jgi:hypothetical protein
VRLFRRRRDDHRLLYCAPLPQATADHHTAPPTLRWRSRRHRECSDTAPPAVRVARQWADALSGSARALPLRRPFRRRRRVESSAREFLVRVRQCRAGLRDLAGLGCQDVEPGRERTRSLQPVFCQV